MTFSICLKISEQDKQTLETHNFLASFMPCLLYIKITQQSIIPKTMAVLLQYKWI